MDTCGKVGRVAALLPRLGHKESKAIPTNRQVIALRVF
jgi:hypothetical protein